MSNFPTDLEDWLHIRLDAVADLSDKFDECTYFLGLASNERELNRFRWVVSAFFGAVYSYLEIKAVMAYERYIDPVTNEPIDDEESLEILREYIRVLRNERNPQFVKTAGVHPTLVKLYEFRKRNTHYYPLLIRANGKNLPDDFIFEEAQGQSTPVLHFCNEVLDILSSIEERIGNT